MSFCETPNKFETGSRLRSESGQGMVEYILVIVVTVIIIAGLAQRLYKPLGDFVQGIMGTYIACLLETGELPSLGGEAGAGAECKTPPIAIVSDPNSSAGGPNGSEGDGKTNGNPNAKNDSDSDGDKLDRNSGSGGRGQGGPNNAGAGRSRFGGRDGNAGKTFRVGGGSLSGAEGLNEGSKRVNIALDGGDNNGFYGGRRGDRRGIYERGDRYVAITGGLSSKMKEQQERQAGRSIVQKVEGGEGNSRQKKSSVITAQNRGSRGLAGDDIKPLEFGDYVKYILIAGIIIILIALIGGQAMQLSKSWEKSE